MNYHTLFIVIPGASHQKHTARNRPEVDGAKPTIRGLGSLHFVYVSHQHAGATGLLRQLSQPFEDGPHLVGPVHVHTVPQIRLDRIEHRQSRARLPNGLRQPLVVHGKPLRQQSRQRQHEGGLAVAGIALDDGDLAPRQGTAATSSAPPPPVCRS